MAEPKGTTTWLVDASACGQKGLHWRTHLSGDKFITRPSDAKAGYAPNGESFRGAEEYKGWVRNVQTDKWLPIRDIPATGASDINDELHERGIGPTGRGKQARDSRMLAIPYLHLSDCECGGKWCKSPAAPEEPLPEPRRRKPALEFVRPPAPTCVRRFPVLRPVRSFALYLSPTCAQPPHCNSCADALCTRQAACAAAAAKAPRLRRVAVVAVRGGVGAGGPAARVRH
jgi:hypothetical protein